MTTPSPYYPMSPSPTTLNTTSTTNSSSNSRYNTGTNTPTTNGYYQQHNRSNSSNNGKGGNATSMDMNNYSLESLLQEPEALAHQKEVTINNMKQLALEHYHLFIDNFKKFNQTHSQMTTINSSIDVLVERLPAISKNCESFSMMSQAMTGKRTANKTLLDNFPTILDLLEVPQLMDTCVKSGSYEEALQLEAFSKKIAKQYPNIKIVNEIVSEIQTITQTLISNLQQSLRGNISLTDSIKIVGLLRRLGVYKENELKTILLYSRDQWLMNAIKLISDPNPINYLTKLTDCCRTNLFDIVTQFNAIFSDDSDDETNIDDFILYGWIELKISYYLSTLETILPLIKEGSGIAYVLENAMYYSSSMSRVGVDFRSLLTPLFERTIINFLISKSATATHHFLESLKSFKFQQPNLHQTVSPSSSHHHSSSSIQIPPQSILGYLPLAVLTNSIVSTFIELKECIPISIEYQLSLTLRDILLQITNGIHSFYIQQQSSTTQSTPLTTTSASATPNSIVIAPLSIPLSQNPVFQNFCKCIVEDFLPFIVKCFDLIINNKSGTPSIDISGFTTSLTKLYNPNPTPNTIPSTPSPSSESTPPSSKMNGNSQQLQQSSPVQNQSDTTSSTSSTLSTIPTDETKLETSTETIVESTPINNIPEPTVENQPAMQPDDTLTSSNQIDLDPNKDISNVEEDKMKEEIAKKDEEEEEEVDKEGDDKVDSDPTPQTLDPVAENEST